MRYIIPAFLALIFCVSLFKKKPSYELFIEGASDGLRIVIKILPPILAVMTSVYMLRASGAFDMLINFISPLTDKIGLPQGVLPLCLIRPLSGSGAIGILTDTLNQYGADSVTGKIASVICGSTETTFYCLCVYLSSTRVKNSLKAVPCAVFGDIIGIIMGIVTIKMFNF